MPKVRFLIILYFVVAFIEIGAEYFRILPLIYIFKPLLSILLGVMYWQTSKVKDMWFYLTIFTSFLTNMLFIHSSFYFIFWALIVFAIHRLIQIYYVLKIQIKNDKLSIVLSSVPFLMLFCYVIFESDLIVDYQYYLLLLHTLLVSVLGGIALSIYVMNDSQSNSWLLISVLFFVTLHLIVFIEKYYFPIQIFRAIAMALNAIAYFLFYKYILLIEDKKTI